MTNLLLGLTKWFQPDNPTRSLQVGLDLRFFNSMRFGWVGKYSKSNPTWPIHSLKAVCSLMTWKLAINNITHAGGLLNLYVESPRFLCLHLTQARHPLSMSSKPQTTQTQMCQWLWSQNELAIPRLLIIIIFGLYPF